MKKALIALRAYLRESEMWLFLAAVACSVYGLILIKSATASYGSGKYILVQTIGIVIGIFLYLLATVVDMEQLARIWKWLFAANLLFLATTYFFGVGMDSTGNNSWLRVTVAGFQIGIQPGEVGKILFIITFAKRLQLLRGDVNKLRSILLILGHFLLTIGVLFISSKDMGMTLSYVFIFACMLLVNGLYLRYFAIAGALGAAGFALLWKLNVIPTYMQDRFRVIMDPTYDLSGVGWQGFRSKIAIVGGGLFGQGLGNGTQTQAGSLPAKHTDFIFSVACEELGFLGATVILFLLFFIIIRCFMTTWKLGPGNYLGSVCTGVGSVFLFQLLINVGMCLGILPVIGLTLPFFSYGGTSVMTMFFALGLVASARRFGFSPTGMSKFRGYSMHY